MSHYQPISISAVAIHHPLTFQICNLQLDWNHQSWRWSDGCWLINYHNHNASIASFDIVSMILLMWYGLFAPLWFDPGRWSNKSNGSCVSFLQSPLVLNIFQFMDSCVKHNSAIVSTILCYGAHNTQTTINYDNNTLVTRFKPFIDIYITKLKGNILHRHARNPQNTNLL